METLRKFAALRGWPTVISSDLGSQLESAKNVADGNEGSSQGTCGKTRLLVDGKSCRLSLQTWEGREKNRRHKEIVKGIHGGL